MPKKYSQSGRKRSFPKKKRKILLEKTGSANLAIPADLDPLVVMRAVEDVVRHLSGKFVFAYWSKEDIEQEGRIMALEALSRYERAKPLFSFLLAHVHNRLCNLKRNKLRRNDPPCKQCHGGERGCPERIEGDAYCLRYASWKGRNDAKASFCEHRGLMPGDDRAAGQDAKVSDDAAVAELRRRVDRRLPAEMRSCYLRMLAGEHVPAARRAEVEGAVREILGGALEEAEATAGGMGGTTIVE